MKKLIAVLSMLALFAAAGGAGAQDKDKAPEKAAAEAKAEPAKAEAKKEEAKGEEKKEEAKPTPTPTPTPNKGDVAWMLTSTALVLMMSVPALALFYGGMVRSKNALSMMMQVFVVFSLVTVLWCVYGYSLAFTEGNSFYGGFSRLFLNGTFDAAKGTFENAATFSKNTPIPELVYVVFQATFAAITCCLVLGAFAERAKFSAVLLFITLWFTFSYVPIAHMVWFWMGPDAYTDPKVVDAINAKAGLLWQWGALDFAGGTVVHINSGVAGLVGAYVMGKRIGYGKEAMPPHSLVMTMIGAALLWFGWFGFNVGSNLEVPRSKPTARPRSPSPTPTWRPPARSSRGSSARRSSRASPRCWAPLPAPSRGWWRSRRPPATSACRARS
jgi:Amt family ammonium transporter